VTTHNLGGKKSVGREGWQCVWILAVVNLVGFKTLSSRYKLSALSGFADEEMLHNHYFCRLQNVEDFRSQKNLAAEWSSNFFFKRHVPNRSVASRSVS